MVNIINLNWRDGFDIDSDLDAYHVENFVEKSSINTAIVRKLLNMHTRFGETLIMRFRDRNARIKLRNVYFSKRKFLYIV